MSTLHRLIPCFTTITLGLLAFGLAALSPGSVQAQDAAFEVRAVSDLTRVFPNGYELPVGSEQVETFGIRGEIVSAQVAVHARRDLNKLTARISPLENGNGSSVIPREAVSWSFVGTVPVQNNVHQQRRQDLARQAPARFPDYLMEKREISLNQGSYRGVWLTVDIPRDTSPGVYFGQLELTSASGSRSIPVRLRVYPAIMPSERHFHVAEWYGTSDFDDFHGIEERYSEAWYDMLATYAENMAAHRQNVYRVGMDLIDITQTVSGEFTFDFSRFDRVAEVFWDAGKMDLLETGFLTHFGEGAHASTEIYISDIAVRDETSGEMVDLPGRDVIPELLPAFVNHLEKKGWADRTIFHIKDEPNAGNVMPWLEISAYLHQYMPSIPRIDALATSYVLEEIEIAVPKLDKISPWWEAYRDFQTRGGTVWFYTVGMYQTPGYLNKTIDMPLIDNRLMPWLAYRYGLKGYLHWGFNKWTADPYEELSEHTGDGWMVYPTPDGLLNSLRWEQLRNGVQDYEILWLLEDRIRHLADSLGVVLPSAFDPSQRGREIARQVVKDFGSYDRSPEALTRARRQVLEELRDLHRTPKLYVQTSPVEGTTLYSEDVTEGMGFVDPGSIVEVNGEEVPVNANGRFMIPRQNRGSKIVVRAQKDGQVQRAVRHFRIQAEGPGDY